MDKMQKKCVNCASWLADQHCHWNQHQFHFQNLVKVLYQSRRPLYFLNWRQIFKTPNYRGDPNWKSLFLSLIYRAKSGLHNELNFFCERARCAKFFLSRSVFAKNFEQKKEGLGPLQLSKHFYFFSSTFLDPWGSSDKNWSPFGEQEKL